MKVSVITSSVNRKKTLARLWDNLVAQTRVPDEIILVEAGGARWDAAELPAPLRAGFQVHDAPGEALSASRARGQRAATGDVLFFFDDDIVLPPTYIAEALAYLEAHPAIMAVGGTYRDKDNPGRNDGAHWTARLFGIHGDGSANRLLLSGWTDFARGAHAQRVTAAEWLFGCNYAVRATAFPAARFETRMKAWSFLEDVFFGLSLRAAFGDCLRLLPGLHVLHDPPTSGGRISPVTLRMRILYRVILWRDHLPHTAWSFIRFALGMVANLLLMLKQERKFWVVPETLRTLAFAARHTHLSWEAANEFVFQKT